MSKKAGLSRKEKAQETRNMIYESAKHLFAQKGFEQVNVDNIVNHAGVSKGSFYVHFDSKDALISVLVRDYVREADVNYEAYLTALPASMRADERLLALVGKIADVLTQDIGHPYIALLYRIQLSPENSATAAMDQNRGLLKLCRDIITTGIEQRCFDASIDIEKLCTQFMTMYRGLTYEWCISYPDYDLKEKALALFKLMLYGLLRNPASVEPA